MLFQFHKVRLKEASLNHRQVREIKFQFHKVRLKVCKNDIKRDKFLFQFHKVRLKAFISISHIH